MAEIEKQFTRLEAGARALRRVQANLKRYRAAVLKAACKANSSPPKPNSIARQAPEVSRPANNLLNRILTKRRQSGTGRGQVQRTRRPRLANLRRSRRLEVAASTWSTYNSVGSFAQRDLFRKIYAD